MEGIYLRFEGPTERDRIAGAKPVTTMAAGEQGSSRQGEMSRLGQGAGDVYGYRYKCERRTVGQEAGQRDPVGGSIPS